VWLDSLADLRRLQEQEREIWTDLGLLDFDVESERRAAKELIGEAATEEREAIELVIRLWDSAEQGMRESIGEASQSPEARAEAGIARLKKVDAERRKLRERMLEEATESESEE
jgi:vacuolar-type H+-ATPase subunit I/STV1